MFDLGGALGGAEFRALRSALWPVGRPPGRAGQPGRPAGQPVGAGILTLENLCNQPLKGYPRIKKGQKIGPDHK